MPASAVAERTTALLTGQENKEIDYGDCKRTKTQARGLRADLDEENGWQRY
jgi:hypothetical protein